MALSAKLEAEFSRRMEARRKEQGKGEEGAYGVPSLGSIGAVYPEDVPTLEECRPGLKPSEYNIIVAVARIREQTEKGVLLSDETKETLQMSAQLGRIIRVSPLAFNYDNLSKDQAPCVGDLVWFARYGGNEFTGRDGRTYRFIKDKDVIGVIEVDVGASGASRDHGELTADEDTHA
jgi:co-chaperonin GroES (HSP10)